MMKVELDRFHMPLHSPLSMGMKIVAALHKFGEVRMDVLAKLVDQDPKLVEEWVVGLRERGAVERTSEFVKLKEDK